MAGSDNRPQGGARSSDRLAWNYSGGASMPMSKPFLELLNRLDEQRRSGDTRSLNQVAKEIVAALPNERTKQFVVELLCHEMLKEWRRKTLTLDPTINEVELPLPFEWPDGIGRYRTSHLV